MMKVRTVVAVILALSLILAACGGSSEVASDPAPSEAAAPAQSPTQSPQSEPTPAPAQPATDAPQPDPTPAESATNDSASAPADAFDVAAHLSAKTMDLWVVYNMHEPDLLSVFYSTDYWAVKKEEVRDNMQLFKRFDIAISAEETSPPTETEPGKWEVWHHASLPIGSLEMLFIYEEFDGEWRLTYAEAQ